MNNTKKVHAEIREEEIMTYVLRAPANLPMFFEKKPYQGATGKIYPLQFTDGITDEKRPCKYKVATIENEYIKVRLLPEIGGKMQQAYDKINGYDFIYHNRVVKPAMIGLGGPWISGGIEFNWPQHHRPTTFLPVETHIEEGEGGEKIVWIGETEPFNRTRGIAGVTLCPGRSYIKLQVRVHNPTEVPQPFMWWANLAVSVNDSYRFVFPRDVEYMNDHDRRAVISWPVAKGIYNTARKFDYGEGLDLSKYPNTPVQSSFMVAKGQSDMDFVSGYDEGRNAGVVTIANHHIAPGKKLFHWGKNKFGDRWCQNLTDDDGPYVELMTGVYTDNQPDFTWIMPNETKCFEQYWYPIREIGCVKNATADAALNIEARDGGLFFGVQATGSFEGCELSVYRAGEKLWSEVCDLSPDAPYTKLISELAGIDDAPLTARVRHNGRDLVKVVPYERGKKAPITPRTIPPRPADVASNEELYLHGAHLVQYKHHTYVAEDYFLEALRRDGSDMRCNLAMGNSEMARGKFASAERYYEKAVERLTWRNDNPADTEALYRLGLCRLYMGKREEAYKALYRSVWSYAWASAGYYQLALMDAYDGNYFDALDKLEEALNGNARDRCAHIAKACMLRCVGELDAALAVIEKAERFDPLDSGVKIEKLFILRAMGKECSADGWKAEYYIDAARFYLRCGLYADAANALELFGGRDALCMYYHAFCLDKLGDCARAKAVRDAAEACRDEFTYPAQLSDIAVLECCGGAFAAYLLGCLYYDRFRYDDAAEKWQESIALDPSFAPAHRNMALWLFDKKGDKDAARRSIERAFELEPANDRIFYEYQQLLKNSDEALEKRIALFEANIDITRMRDDCLLEYAVLLTQVGRFDDAVREMHSHSFHTYEGGEGKVTKHHAWMHLLHGYSLLEKGDIAGAEAAYNDALVFPENYGEEKNFFAQENHVYLALAQLKKLKGEDAGEMLRMAAHTNAIEKNEINYFQGLAKLELGDADGAAAIFAEMLADGTYLTENSDLYAYFGVGSPTPMPFEYDKVKDNLVRGHMLRAYAFEGMGRRDEATAEIEKMRALSPYHFLVHTFDNVIRRK